MTKALPLGVYYASLCMTSPSPRRRPMPVDDISTLVCILGGRRERAHELNCVLVLRILSNSSYPKMLKF
jgi:hypothetical protein